ncbi:cytochrome P450 [Saccharopolyspora sp. NPDC000359]|uniref:cytochrome P450 n=1 Tax=Saccharopolyspora sp. NPDC000359 TaxID=3154251 RepID=UPI00332841AD
MPVHDFDLNDPTISAAEGDAELAALRAGCPLAQLPAMTSHPDRPVFVATSDEAVRAVVASSDLSALTEHSGTAQLADRGEAAPSPALLFEHDGNEHLDHRRALIPLLGPRAARAWEPRARELAAERVRTLRPRGQCDAVPEIAAHVTWQLTGALLGIPAGQQAQFTELAGKTFASPDNTEAEAAFDQLLLDHIAHLRRDPGDDVISAMLPLPAAEDTAALRRYAKIISAASSLTTVDTLANALLHLAQDPALADQARTDPAVLVPLTDEIVRTQPAAPHTGRRTTTDTVLAGQPVPAGATVVLSWRAAATDPAVHDAPQEVRLDRRLGDHAGWGRGPHRCIGRELAMVTVPAVLEEVLRGLPDLALGGVVHRRNGYQNIPHLPLRWTP